ncbi:tetratricopeptide repeat protein [Nonomuraea sp. NPDC050540]|uniref:tetratricopeptide repeat protein n=1 Tax=Nonomuraea sp. NPDC050540 TaxID=3364367 RepID=UPI00379BAA79
MTPEERKQAYDRVIGALLAVAERTDRQVQGAFTQGLRRGNAPRWLPADIDHMVTDSANWIEAEGLTFSAAVCLAVEMGWDEPAWELISSVELLNMHAGFSPARVAEIETVVEVCRQNGNRHGEAMMLRTLATAFTATDQLGAARTRFEQAAAIVDELDDDFGRAMCHGGLGLVDMLQGNLDDALERLELCRALCEQIGNPTKAADTMARMAGLHLQRDLPDKALRLAKDGLSALPTGDPTTSTVEGNLLRVLAEAAGKLGLHQEALEASTRSVTLARQIGHLLLEALALRSRGEARIALGSPADGLADLRLALQLALRIRDRWVEGRVLLTFAEAEPDRAISHLETAATIFAEIGTPVWHERTLTALNAARTRR